MNPIVWYFLLASIACTMAFFILVWSAYARSGLVTADTTMPEVLLCTWASISAEPDGFRKIFTRVITPMINPFFT